MKYRLPLVILIGVVTVFMAFNARNVTLSYDFAKTVPQDDPDMIEFMRFKGMFGEDGNLIAIGVNDSAVYDLENFRQFRELSEQIRKFDGVQEVFSLPEVQRLEKDTAEKKFVMAPIFHDEIASQGQLDSLLTLAFDQKFYSGRLINESNGATLMLISIDKEILNSQKRIGLTEQIIDAGDSFVEETGIPVHYAGLPFVRSVIAGKVRNEMEMFLILSVLVTALILFLFFRTWDSVVFPIIIIGVVVIWVLGSLVLFGYKITMLTALIPSVIVVIGIPNSVYLINKYHQEYERSGNKVLAISKVVRKIGVVTLITNFTTAIGFLVLATTEIVILREFGIIAGLNIMATFVVSIILIPAVFMWLPAPSTAQLKHLKFKPLEVTLSSLDRWIYGHRTTIYIVTALLVIAAIAGTTRLKAVAFMVDDIPEKSTIRQDLEFFEQNFSGIMPLEMIVDTGERRGVLDLRNLRRIERLETFLNEQQDISLPVSLVSFVKASKQAFYNNNPARYDLPSNRERGFILRYMRNQSDSSGLFSSFVDSTLQVMRVSMQVADIGSNKMDSLVQQVIRPEVDSLVAGTDLDIVITGTTPLFIRGNKFLIENLRFSLILAFALIAVIMAILFRSVKMILISLLPNIIPLLITAGIMGFVGLPLKPSTALIFSIVFGISVDDSIHFLAKYRQELFVNRFQVPVTVSRTLRETGASMIYTSIILFAGFVIFAWSDFGGTIALGVLTSITLLIAMCTNLILLPSLLLSFDDGKRNPADHPLIEQYDDGFYQELEEDKETKKYSSVDEKPLTDSEKGHEI